MSIPLPQLAARLAIAACVSLALAGHTGAQNVQLRAYYSFDDGTAAATEGGPEYDGFVSGSPALACGVQGGSLLFDGVSDYLTFAGPINRLFENSDFVLSLYFHPTGVSPRQTLLRKKMDCDDANQRFSIEYLPGTRELEITFAQNASQVLGGPLDPIALAPDRCWYHLVVERQDNELRVYLDGERVRRFRSGTTYNIDNNFNLELANSACPTAATNFQGFIDEVRVYAGRVPLDLIEDLYLAPDRIAPLAAPVIDIGSSVQLDVPLTCADDFAWTPDGSVVAGQGTPAPTVQPTTSTTYYVTMGYPQSGCRSVDSVLVQVFDPDEFDCTQVLVPSGFTPNGRGPVANELLTISNAATLQTFESFEVYDRWGNRVFASGDKNAGWDGSYQDEPAMPGIYLWRVAFGCNGEDLSATGSVKLVR